MEKSPKSHAEIERLVLHELHECDGCEGVMGVFLVSWGSNTWDSCWEHTPNWTVLGFDAGTGSDQACERALTAVVPRLQSFYEMVQKH